MKTEILSSIDKINDCVMESKIKVINALINSYTKAIMIMENCSEDVELSSYNIIQEMFVMEADTNDASNNKTTTKQNIFKRALKAIMELIDKIKKFIKSKYQTIRSKIGKDNGSVVYLNREDIDDIKNSLKDVYDITKEGKFDNFKTALSTCLNHIKKISTNDYLSNVEKSGKGKVYHQKDINNLNDEIMGNSIYSINSMMPSFDKAIKEVVKEDYPSGEVPEEFINSVTAVVNMMQEMAHLYELFANNVAKKFNQKSTDNTKSTNKTTDTSSDKKVVNTTQVAGSKTVHKGVVLDSDNEKVLENMLNDMERDNDSALAELDEIKYNAGVNINNRHDGLNKYMANAYKNILNTEDRKEIERIVG